MRQHYDRQIASVKKHVKRTSSRHERHAARAMLKAGDYNPEVLKSEPAPAMAAIVETVKMSRLLWPANRIIVKL